jgi:hypothetical protein
VDFDGVALFWQETRPAARVRQQTIGKPRGGITTKILALTDAFGNLISFRLMPDQAHHTAKIEPEIPA